MPRIDGPDFICVGMPKAGTGWLYDQLLEHPDFWMPPVKEIRYLDNEMPKMGRATRRLARANTREGLEGQREDRDKRDHAFLERASALGGQPMNIRGYADMFNVKGDKLTGDVTPAYAALNEETIAQIAEHLPQVKVVLLVRDPVSRTWSHIGMKYRTRSFNKGLVKDASRFRRYLETSRNVKNRSFPTTIVERWARVAPRVAFRYFFFDDLVDRPDWLRREIITFIGGDPDKRSGALEAGHNRKATKKSKRTLTLEAPIRAVLVDFMRDELIACAEKLGGRSKDWLTKYKIDTSGRAPVAPAFDAATAGMG